jgi:hypothetical protein
MVLTLLALSATTAFGQEAVPGAGLRRGNLAGLHPITVTLKPNVTLDQFTAFFVSKVLPEYERAWVGLHGYLVKSFHGRDRNALAIVWLFETEAARNRYFTADGKANDLEKAAYAQVKPVEEALKQYGTYTVHYTDEDDWVVQ